MTTTPTTCESCYHLRTKKIMDSVIAYCRKGLILRSDGKDRFFTLDGRTKRKIWEKAINCKKFEEDI